MQHRLYETIDRAIAYLRRSQLDHGEWPTFVSPDSTLASARELDSTPFATALILYCVREIEGEHLAKQIDAALAFLRADMRGAGLWCYWSRFHPRRQEAPPDLDDIACVAWVLRDHAVEFPSCEALVLDHRNAEGLLRTWLVPRRESTPAFKRALRSAWTPSLSELFTALPLRDMVDMGVLANALLFLGQEDDRVKPSIAKLIDCVNSNCEIEHGDYYTSRPLIWYFISRAYRHGVSALEPARAPILAKIDARLDGETSLQDRALMITTLLNLSAPVSVAAQLPALLDGQHKDGSWPAESAYIFGGRERAGGLFYGSEALTTGFCVEALARARATLHA
ncbi:hypothetical protein [Enhygromyxa salina]|uniref:Prenyltransferase n=1 Tax=Enhygromyxa salina TaxID=215803 RepID=A0A2S9YPD5_9BACT|nr:hypothetical protein [Enhygromyxa salina]PRQ06951.1 hypothetical protein ENSA7_33750 [Enhygromyxa salina]